MLFRSLPTLLLAFCPLLASGQTVRFDTNVGSFDMILNPTGLDALQPHVENMLAYIESGRYHASTINRAPSDFVLQMGSFITDSLAGINSTDQYNSLEQFPDVTVDADGDGQVDFDTPGAHQRARDRFARAVCRRPQHGGSSFFVNVGDDNSFLDAQGFIPFAVISDMTVVDEIMALSQQSLDSSLTFVDVPFTDDGEVVIITNTEVIAEAGAPFMGPIGPAAATDMTPDFDAIGEDLVAGLNDMTAAATAEGSSAFSAASAVASSGGSAIPEPTTAALLALGLGLGRPASLALLSDPRASDSDGRTTIAPTKLGRGYFAIVSRLGAFACQ